MNNRVHTKMYHAEYSQAFTEKKIRNNNSAQSHWDFSVGICVSHTSKSLTQLEMLLYETDYHDMIKSFKRSGGPLCLVNPLSGWAVFSDTGEGSFRAHSLEALLTRLDSGAKRVPEVGSKVLQRWSRRRCEDSYPWPPTEYYANQGELGIHRHQWLDTAVRTAFSALPLPCD